jgi:S1-C subfamily serine protease
MPYARGVGFAVPTVTVLGAIAQQEERREQAGPPRLGVSGMPAALEAATIKRYGLSETHGVLLLEVQPASPADRASLRPLDVILRLGEKRVSSMETLKERLDAVQPGDSLEVSFLRAGTLRKTHVVIGGT